MQTHHTPQYSIKILNSNTTLKTIHTKFTVGRSLKCDLRVQLPSVEDKHLVIYLDDRKYVVSGDDVMVNGAVVSGEGVFEYGDVFDVRGTRFVVMEDEDRKDMVGADGREMGVKMEESVGEKELVGVTEGRDDAVNMDNNMENDILNEEPLITAAQRGDVAKTFNSQVEQRNDAYGTGDVQPVKEEPTIEMPRMHQEVPKVMPKVELTNDTQEEEEEGLSTNYENEKTTVIEEKIPAGGLVIEEEMVHKEIVRETVSIDTFTKGRIAEDIAGNLKEEMRNDLKVGFVDEIRDELKDEVKDVIGSDGVRKLLVNDVMERMGEEIKEKIVGESVDKEFSGNSDVVRDMEKEKIMEMNETEEPEVKDGMDQETTEQNVAQEVGDKKENTIDQVENQKHDEIVIAEAEQTKNEDLKEKEEASEHKAQNVAITETNDVKSEVSDKKPEKEPVKRVRKGKAVKKEVEHEEKDVKNEDVRKEAEGGEKGPKNRVIKKEVEHEGKGTKKGDTKKARGAKMEKDVEEEKTEDMNKEEPVKETKTSRKVKADATPKRVKKDVVEPETKKKGRRPSVPKKAAAETKRKGSVSKTAAGRRRKR